MRVWVLWAGLVGAVAGGHGCSDNSECVDGDYPTYDELFGDAPSCEETCAHLEGCEHNLDETCDTLCHQARIWMFSFRCAGVVVCDPAYDALMACLESQTCNVDDHCAEESWAFIDCVNEPADG